MRLVYDARLVLQTPQQHRGLPLRELGGLGKLSVLPGCSSKTPSRRSTRDGRFRLEVRMSSNDRRTSAGTRG